MKASFHLSSAIDKSINILAFIPVLVWIFYPHMIARADFSSQSSGKTAQVFEVKGQIPNPAKEDQIAQMSAYSSTVHAASVVPGPTLSYAELAANDLDHQIKITYKDSLRDYLISRRSPFANCVDTLVELKNADKILSLSNAESGLGLRAPAGKHNYWGVGGSKLWKMGDNVCEGIVSMDNFLNEYPRRSSIKYADMSIDRMNGLYKQPRARHWSTNNNVILNQLSQLRAESTQIALANVESSKNAVHTATAKIELAQQ